MDDGKADGGGGPGAQRIELDEEHVVEVLGYRWNRCKTVGPTGLLCLHRPASPCIGLQALAYLLIALTLGILRVVLHWKPRWMLALMSDRASLRDATVVLLRYGSDRLYQHSRLR